MRQIAIEGEVVATEAADLQDRLADAQARHVRPLCLCRNPGLPLYIARVGGRLILKRMPGTGARHDPICASYEPPYELSGLGAVAGSAISEDLDTGNTLLKLDFSLTKSPARAPPAPSATPDKGEVRSDGTKLTLRALLHYLWDQAGFNRWRRGMAGKRNWAVIRKFLLEAAEGKTSKGKALPDILYVPERFQSEREAEIAQRRSAFMARAVGAMGKGRPLLLVVGEVKDIAPARSGHRLVIKHAPKFPFLLNEDIHRRLGVVFASELSLWNANPDTHLVAIATFGLDSAGVATVEAIALMVVTENWIPFESVAEAGLLDALTRRKISFLKGLRYNLPASQPLASVVLHEDAPTPLAMFVVPREADAAYRLALDALIASSDLSAWTWSPGDEPMPALPV
ncbi:DUF1173 domain-containing protein [Bosea vaviloviae]|uniref:DUF1173 domain-containing protein n=1 Tax=Bosea vaviloviae TaxID=1526658 RepID=A0A1D7UC82_9HYPH|nr:DUF1173 domain-containing protein [Bosea vaviloviae]AOO84988.1 hypothetical protein BHK69_30180 [Bosea vaviloviae]